MGKERTEGRPVQRKYLAVIWLLLSGGYVLFTGTFSTDELVLAALSAGVMTGFIFIAYRHTDRRFSLQAPWLRLLSTVAVSVIRDAGRVAMVLLRVLIHRPAPHTGRFTLQDFQEGGETARDAGRRALITLAVSLAPNGFAAAIPPGEDALLLHRLAPAPPAGDRVWPL